MEIDTDIVLHSSGVKRSRQEGQDERQTYERKRRGHSENISSFLHRTLTRERFSLSTVMVTNPPNITEFLEFTVDLEKERILVLTNEIKRAIKSKQLEEIQKHTENLAEMVSTDPRLIHEVNHDVLNHFVQFLEHTENPRIQSQAIIILQTFISYTINNQWIVESIKDSVLVNLICSQDQKVKSQAMWLLRTMAVLVPKSQFSETLEVVVEPLCLLIDGSTINVIYDISQTLAVVCEVYPMLPPAKFEMVYDSLLKLFDSKSSEIPPHVCLGLLYLCDGRQEMVISKKDFAPLIDRLIEITKFYNDWDLCDNAIAALTTLGTIVRWGSDDDIEVIISKKDALPILGHALHLEERDFVENACWIISNITAGKKNHIKAVIDSGLIERLCGVVENYKLLDIKKEAAWAISNAIYGVGPDRIEDLRSKCVEPFWSILKVFRADQEIVSFLLEGLIILGGLKVSYNDQPIDAAELKKLLVRLRGAQFQLADVTKGLGSWKKPRYDENIKRSYDDSDIILHVTGTFKEEMQQPDLQICLVYERLEKETKYALRHSDMLANEMEVDQPKSFWCI
ncbi:importin subunit alpha-like isoform X2 [Apium graveolens]|uniref:importin subunit alpha-like isoform X2 n=1 Tax=Apium graveolens TaxID=4045 RepID=UPI003D7C107A